IGALLGFRFLLLLLPVGQAVDLADQQKQRKGHDEKVDHVIDKDAVIEGRCPRFFGCGQGTELPDRSMNRLEKSICPSNNPMGGIRMSLTKEVTILLKAAPITTPTARSTTLPRMANALNSFSVRNPSP